MPSAEVIEFRGAGGITLRGSRWDADGPDVLMLHGGGQTRHSWKAAAAQLADRGFRVTSMDARGHGESDWAPDADYSLPSLVGDIEIVLEQIGRPVILVGASMGGLTGLTAAHEVGPDVVVALVLVDVVPQVEEAGSYRIRNFMASGMDGFDTLDAAADAIADYLPHRRRKRNYEGLKRNLRERDGRWYWHWDPEFLDQPKAAVMGHQKQMEAAAQALRIPVLLLHGGLSDIVSAEGAQRFQDLVPELEVVTLPKAAHTAAGDDNESFTNAVIDFVDKVEARR